MGAALLGTAGASSPFLLKNFLLNDFCNHKYTGVDISQPESFTQLSQVEKYTLYNSERSFMRLEECETGKNLTYPLVTTIFNSTVDKSLIFHLCDLDGVKRSVPVESSWWDYYNVLGLGALGLLSYYDYKHNQHIKRWLGL